ncbi:thiamine diphosphate-binding protein [Aspergillus ambiguus]|uniref:thiamine diphosphate-binding protein n=1 Tax=Aspergillus ambiguus TaxID=176160 RepID=UPI003CCD15FA
MGHAACGAVGIASDNTRVLAFVGDGAMLLQNEVSTAVQHLLPIIWLVMNDACYNMCRQVPNLADSSAPECSIPQVDFALYGRALGAAGYSASFVKELRESIESAIAVGTPTVIDARIDGNVRAPVGARTASLAQGRRLR